jgi:hypothetical protein
MNYNPLPVRMKAMEAIAADELQCQPEPIPTGRGADIGEEFETTWIRCKHLEWELKAERIYVNKQPADMTPIRDVLVFTPVYRLEAETVQAVLALEWDGPLSWLFQRDNPYGDSRPKGNQLHQYQRGREAFLRGSYDAMLVIESDIIPPKDALKRLAGLGADCGYGVYQFRRSRIINIFELYPTAEVHNVGESLSIKPHLIARALRDGKIPCSGGGLGICLIRRRVLEKIEFRLPDGEGGGFCDSLFTDDVLHNGFTSLADMRAVCGHKDTDGVIYWPEYAVKPDADYVSPPAFPPGYVVKQLDWRTK